MDEHVYMTSGNRRCRESRWHSDADCPRLGLAKDVRAWPKETTVDRYPQCQVCATDGQTGGASGKGHLASLKEAAAD